MAGPGRVQAPELNLRPSLNPAPVVDVVPVRPVNRDGEGSNLMQIAESLSGLSSSFGRWAASTRQTAEEPKDYFPDTAQSFTPEQIVNDPRFNVKEDTHRILLGTNTAHQMGRQFQQMVQEEWDPEQEPLDAFLNRKVTETMEKFQDPTGATQAGYGKTIDTYVKETRTWWDKLQAENADAQRQQEMWKSVFNAADFEKDKRTLEERTQAAKNHLDELRSLKMLDGKTANQLLFNTMQQYAELGDKDMVRALAEMRRGRNNEIDPLADSPEWTNRVDELIAAADKNWLQQDATRMNTFKDNVDKLVDKGSENELTAYINSPEGQRLIPDPIARAEFIRTNVKKLNENILTRTKEAEKEVGETKFRFDVTDNFWRGNGGQNYTDRVITLKDGTKHTIPSTKAQEYLDEDIRARYEAAAAEGPEAVATLDKTLARVAGQSSLKITEWENIWSNVITGTNESALLEGKVPPNMKRAYELWKNTKGHEATRRANMGQNGDKVDDLFAAVEALEAAGVSTENAMTQAYVATRPERWNPAVQRVNEVAWGSGSSDLELRDRFPPAIAEKLIRRATIYASSSGMTASKAVDKAIKDFDSELIKIDYGSTSYITAPRTMSEGERGQYKTSVETFIAGQIENHGAKANPPIDEDTVSIVEVADGKFMLMNDGEPVPAIITHRGGAGGKGALWFSYEDIQKQIAYDAEVSRRGAITDTLKDTADANAAVEGTAAGQVVDGLRNVGRSISEAIRGGGDEDNQQGLFAGFTDNAEVYYGAKTTSQLRRLSDFQLRNLRKLSSEGWTDKYGRKQELPEIGFINKKRVEEVWRDRVSKARREAGFSKEQVAAAMRRWSTDDELEAIEFLKKNNAQPKKD